MFSVIIPTLNRKNLLKRALLSLRNQTFKNFEVVIVDDMSNDGSYEMIKTFNDLDLKYIENCSNGIIAKSRNKGIHASSKNYIAFLDSDDWWKKNKLKITYDMIKHNNYDFIFHDMHIVANDRRKKFQFNTKNLRKPFFDSLIMNGNLIFNSSVVLKKKLLEEINFLNEERQLVSSEDYYAWLSIFKKNPKIKYLNKKLGYYSIHEGSISKKNMYWSTMMAYRKFISPMGLTEKRKIYSRLNYIKINFKLKNNLFVKKKYFLYSIVFGHFEIKIKTLYFLIKNLLRI